MDESLKNARAGLQSTAIETECRPCRPESHHALDMLSLEISPEKKAYRMGEPILFRAVLANDSQAAVIINNRFLVGYEEQDEREFYFRIFTPEGERYDLPSDHQADIFPKPITLENKERLPPGDAIKMDLPFTPIYQIRGEGTYIIQAVYQSEPFDKTVGGDTNTVYSNMTECVIHK